MLNRILPFVLLTLVFTLPAFGQVVGPVPSSAGDPEDDWNQWRGPNRDGTVPPSFRKWTWPREPVLLWKREVGEGYSGPVVSGNRVYVHVRSGSREVVQSLQLDTGTVLWEEAYEVPFAQDDDARSHGRGPYSTPLVSGGQLLTLGITSILSAWNRQTGELLWRRDYADEFEWSYPYFGNASSPLVWDGLCFVHFGGHKRGGLETPAMGAMIALEVPSGREVWRWDEEGPSVGSSPVIATVENQAQLVFKSLERIVGLDPTTGQQLWQIPYVVTQTNTIVTPLFVGNTLLTSDYEFGMVAWRIHKTGHGWVVRQLWKNRQVSLFMNSPVIVGGQLVGFSHYRKGQTFAVDPSDGSLLWRTAPRSGEHASLVAWDDELLVFPEDGSLQVGVPDRSGFRVHHTYVLGDSGMWAHPAVTHCGVLIRDGSELAYFRFSDEPACADGIR